MADGRLEQTTGLDPYEIGFRQETRATFIKALWEKWREAAWGHFEVSPVYMVAVELPDLVSSAPVTSEMPAPAKTVTFRHENRTNGPPGHGRVVCEGFVVYQY